MFNTVEGRASRVEDQKNEGGRRARAGSLLAPRSSRPEGRRGVLLLVVLSMLVLFMLVGTTFLMTSGQSSKNSVNQAKQNRVGNYGTKLLDRALLEVLRDTDNVNSAVRYHSLLRDVYGTDGFQGAIYKPADGAVNLATPEGQPTRFAGGVAGTVAQQLGPTQGQFIDIYVRALGWDTTNNKSLNDPLTTTVDESAGAGQLFFPNLNHLLKLERNVYSQPQLHTMPLTKGYYNGCLLTITSGPASGQSARILDYEYLADIAPSQTTPTVVSTRLFRFRVMAFQRTDGQPLQINASRSPEISDIAGATFIVNGRAYGGTGAGYNPLAANGQPKLSAAEFFPLANGDQYGAELALLPNSVHFNPLGALTIGSAPGFAGAFGTLVPAASASSIPKLNNPAAIPTAATFYNYPTFVGPGGANESYDAADFQNMFLALLTVTPRSQGLVVQTNGTFSAVDSTNLNSSQFLRLDLENVPLPSFHRPDLINFWYHRLLGLLTDPAGQFGLAPDQAAQAILNPTAAGVNPQVAALVMAIKRQSSLRPLRDDHPNFDGSNPLSVPGAISQATSSLTLGTAPNVSLAVPYWEAVGPWDVDNDNDGIPDSIWVDLGDAVQEAEDGTRYKPLYAFLIIDMDSRLNVNAHGLADDILPPALDNMKNAFFDRSYNPNPANWMGNLAHTAGSPIYSSLQLARGSGYGPAEISLRSVFRAPLDATLMPTYGNRDENFGPVDSLASLMAGRVRQNGTTVDGKYGFNPIISAVPGDSATAGSNYRFILDSSPASMTGETAVPSLAAQLKFFDYPWSLNQRSAFGTPPDLKGRYATGLDYIGQPAYEVVNDPNPNNTTLYFNLLAKSPYELDLSRSQRRDSWATGANSSIADTVTAFNTSLAQNDDAPFSTTDLERVLRAEDADSGTLPSRLWDVVNDFDPLKLMAFDPNRVQQASTLAFSSTTNPELLTTAQQIASINRRNVTTDSFSMPVVGKQMPSYISELGVDGLPGRAGVDDNNNSVVDDASEIGAPGSDDFQALTGTKYSEGTLVDVLRYRIQRDRISRGIAPYDLTVPAQKLAFDQHTSQLTAGPLATVPFVLIQGGATPQNLVAPELLAGQKMDLNRPFGDGRDNPNPLTGALDRVVDDPLEAGEPFLDVNGNGKRDDGTTGPVEPFINLDGSVDGSGRPTYTPPSDQLWNGLTSEPITFDYTNGVAVPIHASVVTALGTPIVGGVRNLEAQGRQLYARQLYCLMLLLTDENYIAPWDENDPQIMTWMENARKTIEAVLTAAPYNQTGTVAKANADLIAKRKYTCRLIAQWAINCADARDSDVIMTPFEYDENPWDGWGCTDRDGNIIPIDGDPLTNENGDVTKNETEVLDWKTISTNNGIRVTTKVHAPASALEQTRDLVWGAERPELLITETLGLHDRRTEDLNGLVKGEHDELGGTSTDRYLDEDMDQRLRPRGSLFVEVYNPWSSTGQYPAELYTKLDQTTSYQPATIAQKEGVELGRLSNWADDNGKLSARPSDNAGTITRSPVWRMIVVEDWPMARNRDLLDDFHNDIVTKTNKLPTAYDKMVTAMTAWKPTDASPPPYHAPNPDFSDVFNSAFVPTKVSGQVNKFDIEYPYIQQEFYFTTDKSETTNPTKIPVDWDFTRFKLRVPYRAVQTGPVGTIEIERLQKFIPISLEKASATEQAIAPIKPGRYGVIGSAGVKYSTLPNSFTTTIGREDSGEKNTKDLQHFNALRKTRRIMLVPDKDPDKPQLVVASNGGDPKDEIRAGKPPVADPMTLEIGRDNELINNKGALVNITDLDNDGRPDTTSAFYQPSVSIPIEGMNISEPPWGYKPREREAAETEDGMNGANPLPTHKYNPTAANGEGSYVTGNPMSTNVVAFDKPFDTARELQRTGSTANYRTIHLQRLANPLLPWNPPPGQFKNGIGPTALDMHRPNLPINPYLTIDTASVNLTAFNGPSEQEHVEKERTYKEKKQSRPWVPGSIEIDAYLKNVEDGSQAWYMRSTERGAWSRLNMAGQAVTPKTSPPQRVLWAQEPAMIDFRKLPGVPLENQVLDLLPGRNMTMRADEISPDAETNLNTSKNNHVNMVLEHSLGFGNESFGLLYDAQSSQGSKTTPPYATAIGAPAPGDYTWDSDGNMPADQRVTVNNTNPWLEWANRPYVSADELLKVPDGSSATMLRDYSMINSATAVNPYDGTGLANQAQPIAPGNLKDTVKPRSRLADFKAPFGHLSNMFASAPWPAGVTRDASGTPTVDAAGHVQPYGAPNFYRILDFVQVPSRYVGTDTMLNAETFNDAQVTATFPTEPVGTDLTGPTDPRYTSQPPFNKVSRQRDPGRVNLNTVTGRRIAGTATTPSQLWSEVFDGIMHREHDQNRPNQLGHAGPAWRDVALSRRGYAQADAAGNSVEKPSGATSPDTFQFGLNNNFPTIFANPFRSAEAADLVPVAQMVQYGIDATLLRKHPWDRGTDGKWGVGTLGDARDAGFGDDTLSFRPGSFAVPSASFGDPSLGTLRDRMPLFSEARGNTFVDTDRNPSMMYQPMTRLGNLVTDRSGVFGIWITVGYFEVEKADDWATNENNVQARFGGDINLYNRTYPDGYRLGRELGSDTGDVKRPRGFYIIDRTEEVGFKPGEDLNVEKTIRLRRRIQ